VEGGANLRRLRALGAEVVAVDDRPSPRGPDDLEVLATAAGGLEALARCDVVVKTPGISRHRPEVARLEAAGVPVAGGMGLWLAGVDPERVAGVTGTKGKSTTTAVAGHLAAGLGRRVLVGGNLGRPPWDPEGAGEEPELTVVEISSFQATDLTRSPAVMAVTSLAPDHLDWHGDAETYFAEKLRATSRPGIRTTLADATSPALRARADRLGGSPSWVEGPPAGDWDRGLGLLGPHNRRNAELARRLLLALGVPGADDPGALAAAAAGFDALDSRLRPVARLGGVDFVDDGLSTNVLPALAALEAFAGRRVALLVGGHDRGLDYAPLAAGVAARPEETLVVTLPDNGPRIAAAFGPAPAAGVTVLPADDLDRAVALAADWARPDGVVLLSPAAPSFGRFRDYRERSAAFAAAVARAGGE
jgi:UDP-N-acetylmuramoylalanine--D-glutamate ligase